MTKEELILSARALGWIGFAISKGSGFWISLQWFDPDRPMNCIQYIGFNSNGYSEIVIDSKSIVDTGITYGHTRDDFTSFLDGLKAKYYKTIRAKQLNWKVSQTWVFEKTFTKDKQKYCVKVDWTRPSFNNGLDRGHGCSIISVDGDRVLSRSSTFISKGYINSASLPEWLHDEIAKEAKAIYA